MRSDFEHGLKNLPLGVLLISTILFSIYAASQFIFSSEWAVEVCLVPKLYISQSIKIVDHSLSPLSVSLVSQFSAGIAVEYRLFGCLGFRTGR
jgi:hypothetical protein